MSIRSSLREARRRPQPRKPAEIGCRCIWASERSRFDVLLRRAELGRVHRDAGEPARAAPPRRFRHEDFRHEDDVGQAAEVRKGELGSFQPLYNGWADRRPQ